MTNSEAYYTSGCTSNSQCVFPNAKIPQTAWSPVAPFINKLIPAQTTAPSGGSAGYYITSAFPETLNDDKGGVRIDADTKYGNISGYYHTDPWSNILPYAGWGGSTVPGFPISANGKAAALCCEPDVTVWQFRGECSQRQLDEKQQFLIELFGSPGYLS